MGHYRLLAWTGLSVIAAAALWHNVPTLAPGMFDWAEPGNVAAALVHGRGFSDPFDGGTGPTAWVSPVPAWIEAAVFVACGVKTAASARVMLAFVVLGLASANALLVKALLPFGAWMAAAASGMFLAYCVLVPGGPLVVLSEAWLDVLLSAVLLWAVLEVLRSPTRASSAALVAVAFLAPLENAGLAAAVGLCAVALAWKFHGTARSLALPLAAAGAAFAAVACWTARNAAVLGRPIPLKSNSWFELHLANVDSADGLPRMETVLRRLPYFDTGEFSRYSQLGEVRYVDSFKEPALAALRSRPLHFAGNVLRRVRLAVAFQKREGGGISTQHAFPPTDAARLSTAGELIVMGAAGDLWTRIDAPVGPELAKLRGLGLADPAGAAADWAAKRIAFDANERGPMALAIGFLTAGFPVAALLFAALLGGGRLSAPGAWAALIGFGMLLPYVLVNHNERHQASIIAVQAVAIGALAQALARRLGRAEATA